MTRNDNEYLRWTSTSATSTHEYDTYAKYVKKIELDLNIAAFKKFEVKLTEKRDEIRKEKKEYMFNPDNLDIEGEQ